MSVPNVEHLGNGDMMEGYMKNFFEKIITKILDEIFYFEYNMEKIINEKWDW